MSDPDSNAEAPEPPVETPTRPEVPKTPVAEASMLEDFPAEIPELEMPEDIDLELEPLVPELEIPEVKDVITQPFRLRFKKVEPPEEILPDYMLGDPLIDPLRRNKDVVSEVVRREPLSPMRLFFETVREVDYSMKDRQDKIFQQRAIFVLNYFVFPWVEGYAGVKEITPEEQVAYMISHRQTLGFFFEGSSRDQVMEVIGDPRIRGLLTLLRPFLKVDENELRTKKNIDWWMLRIKESRRGYYNVIRQYGAMGDWWLGEGLVDIFTFIKGILGVV